MTGLEQWLNRATRHLSKDSAAQVRTEIQQHFESAREAAICEGASADAADLRALTALGDPKTANCQYRKVLLTSAEARVLSQGSWDARFICSSGFRPGAAIDAALFVLAGVLFIAGADTVADIALAVALGMALLFVVPSFPIYTPSRSRVVRCVKWVVLAAMPVLPLGSDALKFSWLLVATWWPIFWIEYTRHSIRRKLPVSRWPKHLYL